MGVASAPDMPRGRRKEDDGTGSDRFSWISTKIHQQTWDRLGTIAKVLSERAASGAIVPIRFELGKAHLLDVIVARFAKEMEIEQ